MMHGKVKIVEADLDDAAHQRAVVTLTASYAHDPMGNGGALSSDILAGLIDALREHPTTLIFLLYADERPVGIATCFLGFSTFAARPLVNIHDLAIVPEYRGRGFGPMLLAAVEQKARTLGCCKVTLEVQEGNARARRVYEDAGFAQPVYGHATGGSLFYAKPIQ